MVDVTNLWPDPKFVSSDETTILAYNHFENPSPVSALTGWNVAGTATVTLDSGASIKGAGGVEVVSPDSTSGLTFSIPETINGDDNYSFGFAVYVRAHAAMTITASVTADIEIETFNTEIGWGDFGWGETFSYEETPSYTFEAGEVRLVRIAPQGEWEGIPRNWGIHLLGTGTFDADAAWLGGYVVDGVDPDSYPGGNWQIADIPPYFDGSTADTAEFIYSWEGTANASRSIKRGNLPKYVSSREFVEAGYNNCRTAILAEGETGFALQADWEWSTGSAAYFLGYGGDLKTLGLTEGQGYVLSIDVISTYDNYISGYPGDLYTALYLETTGGPGTGIILPAVTRSRLHLPIIPGAGESNNGLTCYRNWQTGESYFTDASLFEVEFVAPTWNPGGNAANLPLDLLAHGLEPGKDYISVFDNGLSSGQYYRVEYQTGGGGSWTTIFEDVYNAGYEGDYFHHEFTVPETATAVRLVANTASQLHFNAEFFSAPPAPFSGDTPDGDGYTYSWSGTPYESASIRSDAPESSINAKVFVGGAAVTVSEMRVVVDGTLIPITEAGA